MIVGQKHSIKLIKTALECNKNVLILGPSGYGKSSIAEMCAKESGICFRYTKNKIPFNILNRKLVNNKRTAMIIDEIHTFNNIKQLRWPIFLDQFNGSVIFTSTHPHLIVDCIQTRCFRVILSKYSLDELAEISTVKNNKEAKVIARISRGIPRLAVNYGKIYKQSSVNIIEFITDILGMRPYKNEMLFPEEYRYIKFLEKSGTASQKILKGLNISDIDFVEYCLLNLKLIKISNKGRELGGDTN